MSNYKHMNKTGGKYPRWIWSEGYFIKKCVQWVMRGWSAKILTPHFELFWFTLFPSSKLIWYNCSPFSKLFWFLWKPPPRYYNQPDIFKHPHSTTFQCSLYQQKFLKKFYLQRRKLSGYIWISWVQCILFCLNCVKLLKFSYIYHDFWILKV